MQLVKNKLRVRHFPQVGSVSESFIVEVKDEFEAFKISNALADQHLWLHKNNIIPDYANSILVEMFEEDSDGEGKPDWCDYFNEAECMDWDDFETEYKETLDNPKDFLINREEAGFICSSLNQTYHEANIKLKIKDIGEFEAKQLEKTKAKAKELMTKLDA